MRKLSLMLPLFALAFVACEKEIKQENVRYTGYYVRSPKDASKWITIEEYNRLYPPSKINAAKGYDQCFYLPDGATKWKEGRTCSNTRKTGCDYRAGCEPLPGSN